MSKPKQWKQGRELKHADVWIERFDAPYSTMPPLRSEPWPAYPQEAEPDGRLWVGSGDSV